MAIRAVIFDLDCTLTCRTSSLLQAARRLTERFGTCLAADAIPALSSALRDADNFGYRDRREFFDEILTAGCWQSKPAMEELLHFWQHDFPTCTVAHPDTLNVLSDLRGRGLRLGLITNGKSVTQNGKIEFLKIRSQFDHVIVSGDVGIHKPEPGIFLRCVQSLAVAPSEAAYVGDHAENDILGARSAGLHAIWITTGGPWPAHLPPPERRVDSLRELSGVLDRL